MQKLSVITGLTALLAAGLTQLVPPRDAGYAVGYDVGLDAVSLLKADGVEFDADRLVAGFTDAVLSRDAELDDVARRQILASLEREVATRLAEIRLKEDAVFAAQSEANLERSRAFHKAYGRRDDVTTLPGGPQYRVLARADGRRPDNDSTIVVSFKAHLINGMVVAGEQQQELKVMYLTDGAREVLLQMPAGSTWEAAIPPEKAYGIGGQPPLIGPNETLIFTIEMHEVR